MANRIRRVSRFSTGTVDIHPQHAYRGRSPMYWWILTSRRWLEGRPINVYVIEHADGLVVFDTGQDRASVTDPSYFPDGANGVIYRRLARFHVSRDETFTAGLERLGYATSDVTRAVVSHFHEDHIGGIGEIPGAELLVSEDEWRSLQRPMAETRGLLRARTSTCQPRSGGPLRTNRSTTQRSGPLPSVTTFSGTAHSWSSPRLDTRRVRCRCSCAGPTDLRCCSSGTSPMTYTRSNVASRAASVASARCATRAEM